MHDREEAIHWLTVKGYRAFARDWVLGKTIGVSHRPPVERMDDPLAVIDGPLLYIYPTEDNRWAVYDCSTHEDDVLYGDLGEAVAAVDRTLNQDRTGRRE
jgi:hypothetical protein